MEAKTFIYSIHSMIDPTSKEKIYALLSIGDTLVHIYPTMKTWATAEQMAKIIGMPVAENKIIALTVSGNQHSYTAK